VSTAEIEENSIWRKIFSAEAERAGKSSRFAPGTAARRDFTQRPRKIWLLSRNPRHTPTHFFSEDPFETIMKQFSLQVAPREGRGRGASRRLRREGRIPAVLYGKQNDPVTLSVDAPAFGDLLKEVAGSAAIVEIKAEGAPTRLSVIQEVQRDPLTGKIIHVDFHEVSAGEKMEVEVPVHTVGEAEGVKNENGILEIVSPQLRIRCLPKDLPAFIEVDVTKLHVGDNIHVGEIPAPAGVEFVDDPKQSVVACVSAAAGEEGAEGGAGEAAEEGASES